MTFDGSCQAPGDITVASGLFRSLKGEIMRTISRLGRVRLGLLVVLVGGLLLTLLVGASAATTLTARAARAATVTVTTAADVVNGDAVALQALRARPGPDGISLREALLATNATPGPGRVFISFSPALAGKTIELVETLPPIARDRVTLSGLRSADGQPTITLDRSRVTTTR